ncbi:MAG: DUF2490 domain-containing protein [Pseudomonadota bacterium]
MTAVAGAALLMATVPGHADDDLQQWSVLKVTHPLDERIDLSLMLQGRFADDISEVDVVIVRPDIGYHLSDHVTLFLGYDYYDRPQPGEDSENRVWEQLGIKHRVGDLAIANRLRVEQRIIENVDGVTVRARYRLRLAHPLGDPDWEAIAFNEVFANLNQEPGGPAEGFEQNRLFGGLGYQIRPGLELEAGYMWRREPSASDHILVLGLYLDTGRL